MEGIWTLFLPAYQRFLELARNKICGEPTHLVADFGYPVPVLSPTAEDVLLDRGVYPVALAIKVFGPIEKADVALGSTADGMKNLASVQLSHSQGGQSQLAVSFISLMSNTATLACSRGAVWLEQPLIGSEAVSVYLASTVRDGSRDPTQPLGLKQKLEKALQKKALLRRVKRALPNVRREHLSYGPDKHLPQLSHFLDLLKGGVQESHVVPLELSLAIQRVIGRVSVTINTDTA
jgi:predicted dehydrogenase